MWVFLFFLAFVRVECQGGEAAPREASQASAVYCPKVGAIFGLDFQFAVQAHAK